MEQWRIFVQIYLVGAVTFLMLKQKWELFSFLRKESIESLERKLYGYDQSINPSIITDERGKISSINEAVTNIFGWSELDLIGSDLKKIVPDRFWVAHNEGLKRAIGKHIDDKVFHIEAKKKDGAELPIELLLRKRKIGNNFFYVAILRDETEEKKMMEMYANETQALQSLVTIMEQGEEIAGTGSWYWDLTTSKEKPDTKLFTSKGYNIIMGLDPQPYYKAYYLKGRVFSKDIDLVNEALRKAFRGEPYDITYRTNRTNDFKVILIRSRVKIVKDANGFIIGMYGSTTLIQTLNVIDIITEEQKT